MKFNPGILDQSNSVFNQAVEFVMNTNKNIYLTGKAGTGKTTFLKYIKSITEKNTVVLAPTGVAAINAGGVTIHSFFKIPFGPFVPGDKRLRLRPEPGDTNRSTIYDHFKYSRNTRQIIESLELLIIDEISMVRCDILDVIDQLLKVFKPGNPNLPFGGVQVILIGDTFQLPPVAPSDEWKLLKRFYDSSFFFSSDVIKNSSPVYIELQHIYRQKDQDFITLLNRIRVNKIDYNDINTLNTRYKPGFAPPSNDNFITLATHNYIVDDINKRKLEELPGKLHLFEGTLKGEFPMNMLPTEISLELKPGTQVMMLRNDPGIVKKYFNGKIGTALKFEAGIEVTFSEGRSINLEMATWENIKYKWNNRTHRIEEEVVGTFEQYPLKLAWAITVHKSQGLTFERVIADLAKSFTPGQVYVALSRCTSFNGLVLHSKINSNCIMTDRRVIEFSEKVTPNTLIVEELRLGKADFLYKKAREEFKKGHIDKAYTYYTEAIKFRNDTGSAIFKRYMIARIGRLFTETKRTHDLNNSLAIKEKKVYDLQKLVNQKESIIKQLKIENRGLRKRNKLSGKPKQSGRKKRKT